MGDNARFDPRFIAAFAVGLSLAGLAYMAAITFLPIPKDNIRFADTILGFIIGTVVAAPIGFFFGSSSSSRAKDQVISDMMPTSPDTPTPSDSR
jgi:ABC-type nitrate/sulfonate/bicarbonate transport system permease component